MSGSEWVKMQLLGFANWAVVGKRLTESDKKQLLSSLRSGSFRATAKLSMLREMAQAGISKGEVSVMTPAFEDGVTMVFPLLDFGVGWTVAQTGSYETHLAGYYKKTIKPGMTIVDVGANIGFHALQAAILTGEKGKVYAIEPDPVNAQMIRNSLAASQEKLPIEVLEAALDKQKGEVIVTNLGNEHNYGARFTHRDKKVLEGLVHGENPKYSKVEAFAWDDKYENTKIDFVKIDVEGYEFNALQGMKKSLEKYHPIVVTEFAPSNLREIGQVDPKEYLQFFTDLGYEGTVLERDSNATKPLDDSAIEYALQGHHLDIAFTVKK